jgi:hypothetical protein
MNEVIRLSKNFALSEMVKSTTTERLNVDDSPVEDDIFPRGCLGNHCRPAD